MIAIELDAGERDILAHVIENALSDLRMEIADTDSLDFRERLKARKRVLHKVLDALRQRV